jgi:folate-binding protein YgfZ
MYTTPICERLAAQSNAGVKAGEYCGARTALSFGDTRGEFHALVNGAGVYDLGWRGHFRISGRDRGRWLNGMVTNNARDLAVGRGNYNFLLNVQGRIQGDLYICNCGEYFVAGTEMSQLETVLGLLRKYIIMDKVELTDLRDEITALAVQGPEAHEVLKRVGFTTPLPKPLELQETEWHGLRLSIFRMAGEQFETYELWIVPSEVAALWDALLAAGAQEVGTDAVEMFRVAAGIARYGPDIRDKDLPQETAQSQALNFTKGCYIGQEIVERIRSRGNVHRTLAGMVLSALPTVGAKIQADGKDVGEITSALEVPAGEETAVLALGYLRTEAATPGAAVQIQDFKGTVSELPFPIIFAKEQTHA